MNFNATLPGQAIAFAIFVWFCMKFVWPPLITAMKDRQKRIAEGLQDADMAAKDRELAQEKATLIEIGQLISWSRRVWIAQLQFVETQDLVCGRL